MVTSKEYESYIIGLTGNSEIKKEKNCFNCDNAPSHKIVETTNVEIVFLRLNLTGFLKPLDTGIFNYLKHCINANRWYFLLIV